MIPRARRDLRAVDRCRRSSVCALVDGHPGGCDPRSDRRRAREELALAGRLNGAALLAKIERNARHALARAGGGR